MTSGEGQLVPADGSARAVVTPESGGQNMDLRLSPPGCFVAPKSVSSQKMSEHRTLTALDCWSPPFLTGLLTVVSGNCGICQFLSNSCDSESTSRSDQFISFLWNQTSGTHSSMKPSTRRWEGRADGDRVSTNRSRQAVEQEPPDLSLRLQRLLAVLQLSCAKWGLVGIYSSASVLLFLTWFCGKKIWIDEKVPADVSTATLESARASPHLHPFLPHTSVLLFSLSTLSRLSSGVGSSPWLAAMLLGS